MNSKIETPSSAVSPAIKMSPGGEPSATDSAVTESSDIESSGTESSGIEATDTTSLISQPSTGQQESTATQDPFRNFGIQDYLSLGYIYLLCVGIMTDAIYYKMLGVNILHFTNVLDVLVSPISFMVKRPVIILILVVLAFFVKWIQRRVKKQLEIEWAKNLDRKDEVSGDEVSRRKRQKLEEDLHPYFFPTIMGITVFFLFVGGGIGAGYRVSSRIAEGDLRIDHHLVFNDGEEVNAYVVGQNSDFIFYVTEGNGHVTIAPVAGNVKRIDRINESQSNDDVKSEEKMKKNAPAKESDKDGKDVGDNLSIDNP